MYIYIYDSSILCRKALVLALPQLPTDTQQYFCIRGINPTCSSSHKSHLSLPGSLHQGTAAEGLLFTHFTSPAHPFISPHLSSAYMGTHPQPLAAFHPSLAYCWSVVATRDQGSHLLSEFLTSTSEEHILGESTTIHAHPDESNPRGTVTCLCQPQGVQSKSRRCILNVFFGAKKMRPQT